jgi:hypothetical protein
MNGISSKVKILFINSIDSDGVQDLTISGLTKLLNPKNIIEYPWNRFYHLPLRKYPANLGYTDKSLLSSILSKLRNKSYDFVFVGSAKPSCFNNYLSIIENIPASTPVIFIDGGDFDMIGGDLLRLKSFDLYEKAIQQRKFNGVFKREYLIDKNLGDNVWPLQFSFNFERMPLDLPYQNIYQVAFWGVESNPIRTNALEILKGKFDCDENGTKKGQKFHKYKRRAQNYLRELTNCKIVLNFPGVGWDTQRYWEVPALGKFMISYKPQIKIPNNFINGTHCVFCNDDLSDLLDKCEYYLINEKEREEIALASKEHARKYHSNLSRANYILKTLGVKT